MHLVLVGPPGAGKGTQAHRLQDRFGLPLIATGDLFRANLQEGTPLGIQARIYMDRGEYVPDGVMVEMVDERLHEADASKGFILDGFPRTVPQARALDEVLTKAGTPLDAVVQFLIPDDIAIRRITGRFTCPVCKRTYHQEWRPPAEDRLCDADGTPLEKRNDEDALTVKRRLAIYRDQTQPLEAFYAERELLRSVDAAAPLDAVSDRMFEALRDLL